MESHYPFSTSINFDKYKGQPLSLTCMNQSGGVAHIKNIRFQVPNEQDPKLNETEDHHHLDSSSSSSSSSDQDKTIADLKKQIEIKELKQKLASLDTNQQKIDEEQKKKEVIAQLEKELAALQAQKTSAGDDGFTDERPSYNLLIIL